MARRTPRLAPFTNGMVRDVPSHLIGPDRCVYAENAFAPEGVLRRRFGWEYQGSQSTFYAVYEHGAVMRTPSGRVVATSAVNPSSLASGSGGFQVFDTPSTASLYTNATTGLYLPRASYNGEYLFTNPFGGISGGSSMIRYADAASAVALALSLTGVLNTGTMTGGSTLAVNAFARLYYQGGGRAATKPLFPVTYHRVLRNNAGTLTLKDLLFSNTTVGVAGTLSYSYGYAYPAVPVENAGTVTTVGEPSNTVTGVGTRFTSALTALAILVMPTTGDAFHSYFSASSDTAATAFGMTMATASPYYLTAQCPFKDVAVYNGSLFGCGVPDQPGRVYVGPDGWNLSLPPGFTTPFDPYAASTSSNYQDFLMDFIDIPSLDADDPVVTLLETASGILAIKRKHTHLITGSYPSFSQDVIFRGVGAYSVASSISGEMGAFWVDENGIYWSKSGTDITNIAQHGIWREWQNLMRQGIEYISLGVHANYLLVAIQPLSGSGWSYIYDMSRGCWGSRFLNYVPFYQYPYRSNTAGGIDRLLSRTLTGGRFLDAAPMVTGVRQPSASTADDTTGLTTAAVGADADATKIAFTVWSGSGLAEAAGIEGEAKLIDVSLSRVHYDSSGASSLTMTVYHGDGLSNSTRPAKSKSVTFSSDLSGTQIKRNVKPVNRSGREIQLRFSLTDSTGSADKVELHELVCSFRDLRSRT